MIWNIYVGDVNFFPVSSDLKPPLVSKYVFKQKYKVITVLSQAGLNGILLKPETFRNISYF